MNSGELVWRTLLQGNERHRAGMGKRSSGAPELTEHRPIAAVLACADARAVPDDVFDLNPGSLFEVRTAGHTVDTSALGSLEYAVANLAVPLVVVLGHTHCGAVAAAHKALGGASLPGGALGALIERMIEEESEPELDIEALGQRHVQRVAGELTAGSELIASAIDAGRLTVRAAQVRLEDGSLDIFA